MELENDFCGARCYGKKAVLSSSGTENAKDHVFSSPDDRSIGHVPER